VLNISLCKREQDVGYSLVESIFIAGYKCYSLDQASSSGRLNLHWKLACFCTNRTKNTHTK